jgi:ABC transport system ATP-binding/permease protein
VSKGNGNDHDDIESTIAGDISLVGVLAPRKLALLPTETVIGRGTQASIQIESSLLSRRHVAFRRSGPDVTCADLDSQNGVYVNGVKVHSALLHDGDTLQIGDVVLVFREAPP